MSVVKDFVSTLPLLNASTSMNVCLHRMVNLSVTLGLIVPTLKVALNANVKLVMKVMGTNAPRLIYVHLQGDVIMVNV